MYHVLADCYRFSRVDVSKCSATHSFLPYNTALSRLSSLARLSSLFSLALFLSVSVLAFPVFISLASAYLRRHDDCQPRCLFG